MTVISDLAKLRATLEGIPIQLGDDRYKEIVLESRVQKGTGIQVVSTNLGRHKVTMADKRVTELIRVRDNIGTIIDLHVIKMPKSYSIDDFRAANRIFVNGKRFVLRAIQDEHSVTFKVVIDRVQDNV
jgi:hypothetical protein